MASILDENFNALNDGELDNQNGWASGAVYNDSIFVQQNVVFEGAKAIQCGTSATSSVGSEIYKSGTSISAGTYAGYLRRDTSGAGNVLIRLTEGGTNKCSFGLRDGYFKYYNGGAWKYFNASAGASPDTWYHVEAQWGPSGENIRYRVDSGTWSNYDTPHASWTAMDGIGVTFYNPAIGDLGYADTLGEIVSVTISATALSAAGSVQSPTVVEGTGATVSAVSLSAIFSQPAVTVVEGVGVAFGIGAAVSATFSINTPTLDTVYWTMAGKNTATYSNLGKNSASYGNLAKSSNAWTNRGKRE